MRRTYFVPLCVLAGFFLLSAIIGFTGAVMLESALPKLDEAFEQRYIFSPDRNLYEEAVKLRRELTFKETDKVFQIAAGSLTLAGILLWWAFDRRQLVIKLNKLEGGTTTPDTREGAGTSETSHVQERGDK